MGFIPSMPIAFLMLFITMICWGSWANVLKKCGNWRFEGFYWDYAWSIVFSAIILTVIFGGITKTGWVPLLYLSSFKLLTFPAISTALFAGFVWGLGNILLVMAIILTGFAVAFPLALGLALVLGTSLAYITNPAATRHPFFLFLGLFFVICAVIANGLAYRVKEHTVSTNKNLTLGLFISAACGLLIGLFPFPFNYAFKLGMSGYQGAVFMTIGGFIATCVLLPLLMKKPLIPGQEKVGVKEYFRGKISWHLWAILGGFIWSIGTVFNLVVASLPTFSVAIAYTLGQCAPMVAALWGIFVWKEFQKAPRISYIFLILMFVLFVAGIVSLAQATG